MNGVTVGIDLATSSARCVAIDTHTGAVLGKAATGLPQPVRLPGGSSTQRPDYARVSLDLLGRVCASLADRRAEVRAVSVTGTSGTVVPCDLEGAPVGAARLYDDASGAALLRRDGVRGAAMLARAAALRHGHPAATYASTADVVVAALAGHRVPGDTSHWLKAGIHPVSRSWPDAVVTALGLDADALPALVRPGSVLAPIPPDLAERLGLPDDVVLVAGMTDGCTAQIATGAVHPGDTVGVLGTTLVLKAVSETPVQTPDGVVYSHLGPDGRWWAGGASNTGAGVLAADFPDADLPAMDAAVADTPSSVVRYPLSGAGERFPISDPTFAAPSSGRPRDELDAYRSVLDGVAFVERMGLERLTALGVTPRRHVLAGGASASSVWNRIRAAVLAPLVPAAVTGTASSAVGAAVLAAHAVSRPGTGFTSTVDRLIPEPIPVEPVAAQRDVLDDAYRRFLDLVAAATSGTQPEGAPHHV